LKKNQTLLSISASDLDFIVENHLSEAFLTLAKYNAKVNLVQNSAVSCYFALDVDDLQIDALVEELSKDFRVKCVRGLDLMTVRHYKNEEVDKILEGKDVLLTQKNKTTIQVLHK
jgi:aspartate kinase